MKCINFIYFNFFVGYLCSVLENYDIIPSKIWAGIAELVWRPFTGWTVWGSNLGGGGEIFLTRPDRPWCPPSLLYNGYRVFPGGKAAGTWQ